MASTKVLYADLVRGERRARQPVLDQALTGESRWLAAVIPGRFSLKRAQGVTTKKHA
ncbi:hypothetical protein ACQEU6_33315 [Spirillospora sp. CA-108201]